MANILDLTREQFDATQRPLGKALYKSKMGRPTKEVKCDPYDRIVCKTCGKTYTRCASASHKKTVFHKEREKINKKLLELLI